MMKQHTHTLLNWAGYNDLKETLEAYGFAVDHSETEDDLREAVRSNMLDGTIPESAIEIET